MSKKKIRKGKQLTITNPKNAGRPAIHDIGIRHIIREEIRRPRALHLTIKLKRADIKNKVILKALGVSFSKRLNKFFQTKGQVYRTRFHLRVLKSASEVKNVINYILKNGMKHKRARSFIDPYNSRVVLHDFKLLGLGNIKKIKAHIQKYFQKEYEEYKNLLDGLSVFGRELTFII